MPTTRLLSALVVALGAVLSSATGAPRTIAVPAGGDLQDAIDRAAPGDTLVLAAGATYVGNFVLPVKSSGDGNRFITIRGPELEGMPRAGQRVLPSHAARLPKLRSPNRQPAIRTAPAAHHWRLALLELLPTADPGGTIVALGDSGAAQSDRAQVPHDLAIERCYIHGDPIAGQKRGIALNSAATTIADSYVADIKAVGQEAQAIAGWNGPGPYTIENNYLEGAAENFILGGADPSIQGLVTEDVVFRRNHLAKPIRWRDEAWLVKNLFELKNARRVLVEGNLMEYAWKGGQVGYAVLLTPRNQDGQAPWATVEDVTIRGNVIRHAGAGMQITGPDTNHPSGPGRRIKVVGNVFYDIDGATWGGPGVFLLMGDGPSEVTVERNTVSQSGNIILAFGGTVAAPTPITGFVFRDNLIRHNEYGVHASDRAVGQDALDAYFPGGVFVANGIGGGEARRYPPGNTFIEAGAFDAQFVDAAAGDFRLAANSRFLALAQNGAGPGADMAAIAQSLGVRLRSKDAGR